MKIKETLNSHKKLNLKLTVLTQECHNEATLRLHNTDSLNRKFVKEIIMHVAICYQQCDTNSRCETLSRGPHRVVRILS